MAELAALRVEPVVVTRARRLPWWVKVCVVWLGGRIVSTILLLILASVEGVNAWTTAHPGYFDFANIWDGRWYQFVAADGYPSSLSYDGTGAVEQNTWAFMPGYPYVVRGVMALTRLSWQVAAVDVSLAFGLAATLVFYQLMRRRLKPSESLFATVLFSVAPTAPLLQVAYAEAMYVFLLAVVLYLLLRRRYWMLQPVVVIAAFTRPSGLAIALLLAGELAWRLWRRRSDPVPGREFAASATGVVVAFLSGIAWPIIAGVVTGVPGAYTLTELSWRSSYLGPTTRVIPFASWFQGADWWFTVWLGLPAWFADAVVALLVIGFAALLFTPPVRRLGVVLRMWLGAYGAYLFAVWFPQSSTFRLLMPMFPLLGAMARPRHPAYRIGLVVVSIAAQLGWLLLCWAIGAYDWSPP